MKPTNSLENTGEQAQQREGSPSRAASGTPGAQNGASPAAAGSAAANALDAANLANTIAREVLENFPKQSPGVYRWTIAAVGFLIIVMAATSIIRPENFAGIACASVFVLLLIFLLFSFEKTDIDTHVQARFLTWFSALVLIASSLGLLSSIFLGWPLALLLNSRVETARLKDRIVAYDFRDSHIERVGTAHWQETFESKAVGETHELSQRGHSVDFLLLWDDRRQIHIRIPTLGGMVQWTASKDLNNCTEVACWADIRGVDARLKQTVTLFGR